MESFPKPETSITEPKFLPFSGGRDIVPLLLPARTGTQEWIAGAAKLARISVFLLTFLSPFEVTRDIFSRADVRQ